MTHKERGQSSQRQLRVGEEIRHVLAGVLMRGELRDPGLQGASVTVTEVRASPDLRHATAYVMPLGGAHRDEILAALKRAAPFLRAQVARSVRLRVAPQLDFAIDTSFDYAQRIDRLLRSEAVARDLNPDEPPGDEQPGDEQPGGETQDGGNPASGAETGGKDGDDRHGA